MNTRMNRRILLAAALVLALPAFGAKPSIDVAFAIASGHDYELAFDAAQHNTIRTQVGSKVAALLQDEFPPFDFLARPAEHHLTITLEDDPAAAGVTPAVVLMLRMDAAVAPRRTPLKLVFRTDEMRGEPLGSELAFINDVVKTIGNALATRSNDFVSVLLSTINVTADIFLQPTLATFVLPFTAEEYEIGESSRFLVRTMNAAQLPRDFTAEAIGPAPPVTGMPSRFVQRLRVSAEKEAREKLDRLRTETLQPQAVMMLTYERVRRAAALAPPSSFSVGGGSQ